MAISRNSIKSNHHQQVPEGGFLQARRALQCLSRALCSSFVPLYSSSGSLLSMAITTVGCAGTPPDVAIPRCTPRPQRQRASLVSCHVSVRRGARHLHAAGAAGARQPGQRARDDIRRRVARRRGHGTRACSARRSAQRCAVFVWRVAQQRDSRTQR